MITGKTPPDAMERRASIESKKKEILIPPHKIVKNITLNRENAILNAKNVRIEDRTPDVQSFMEELNANPPAKRVYGKLKKIDLYTWPLWLKILIPSLLSVLLIFGVLLATGVISLGSLFSGNVEVPDGTVIVPDVEGLEKDEAILKIENVKLQVSAEGNVVSDYIQAGRIVLQSPNGGSYIEEYGTVKLTVSSGRGVQKSQNGKSIVPYVIWDTKEDAISKLSQAGLAEPKIETKNDDNVEAGKVISQSVEYGTEVDEGTQITLVISLGPVDFDMPDVTGKDIDEARSTLSSRGVTVTVNYESSSSVAKNKVISQSVSAGTKVKKGDSVNLTVSSGAISTITVPDVVGQSQSSAVSALESAGLKASIVENYHSSVAKGKVISQSPSAGTSQAKNTTITLYVSKGTEPTEAPNVAPTAAPDKKITVSLNANGGYVSPSSVTINLTNSPTYSNLPTPKKDYNNFKGWYTQQSGGSKVSNGSSVAYGSDHTLYAQYAQKGVSGWVRESEVPSGAQIVDTGWSYSLEETTTSSSSSLSGWTRDNSKTTWEWRKTGSGTYTYASFPSGYNTSDSYYQSYGKSARSSSTSGNTKRDYGSSYKDGYIYWHWACENGKDYGNWYISDHYNDTLTWPNGSYWGKATQWCAFRSYSTPSEYSSWESGHCAAWPGKCWYSKWFLELPVYSQSYTDYEKAYTYYYYKITNDLWSSSDPTGQSGVSNVVKYVKYREK